MSPAPTPTPSTAPAAPASSGPRAAPDKVRCIVTVHGMGEPKLNSTLMPVAERIAQAACPELKGDTLTLGGISSLAGLGDPEDPSFIPCIQLRDISIPRAKDSRAPIFLRPSARGENLLFADIHWSDITEQAFPAVGDALPHWTACLIHRVERKRMRHAKVGQRWWVEDMLYLLRRTLLFAERALGWRSKDLSDVVFGRYLGDVQLYGEWAPCRGAAVRLFHDRMARIHAYLMGTLEVKEVEYTVIAHSLGTVLSLDALMLAHAAALHKADDDEAAATLAAHSLPFPGYADGRPLPDPAWIDSVKAFVTLGSPIDKFLTLWWYNYEHMADDAWMRKRPEGGRIRHYNFCDEQDPVGHKLDFARTAKAFRAAFDSADADGRRFNDVVYNHTPIPGYAHVSYWTDQDLFGLIYRRVLLDGPQDLTRKDLEEFGVYRRKVYFTILLIHYYLVPILMLLPAHFSLTWAIFSDSWHAKTLGVLGFLLSLTYGRTVIMLNVGWRRALKQGEVDTLAEKATAPAGRARKMLRWLKWKLMDDRKQHAWNARMSWWGLTGLGVSGGYLASAYLWHGHTPRDLWRADGVPILLVSAAAFSALLIIFSRLGKAKAASRLQDSLVEDRRWAWWREPATLALVCLPPVLAAIPAVNAPGLRFLDWACHAFGHCVNEMSRNALLWVGILCQLSALVWAQVIWHHAWMKRRFSPRPGDRPQDYEWQRDFNVYARE